MFTTLADFSYDSKSSAFDINSGDFLYNEFHYDVYSDNNLKKRISKFVDEKGNIISKREMLFKNDFTKPDFEIEDFRIGYKEGAVVIDSNIVKVYKRDSFEYPTEENTLQIDGEFVIDGGLTYFFRKHWGKLINDEVIDFYFIAPNRLDYYSFRVSKYDIVDVNGFSGMRLLLEPSSFILRAFVDPIYITYDLVTRDILYYEGVSNVYNSNGDIYNVKIDYTLEEK